MGYYPGLKYVYVKVINESEGLSFWLMSERKLWRWEPIVRKHMVLIKPWIHCWIGCFLKNYESGAFLFVWLDLTRVSSLAAFCSAAGRLLHAARVCRDLQMGTGHLASVNIWLFCQRGKEWWVDENLKLATLWTQSSCWDFYTTILFSPKIDAINNWKLNVEIGRHSMWFILHPPCWGHAA